MSEPDTRSTVQGKFYLATCPACGFAFYAYAKVRWPMTEEETARFRIEVRGEADKVYTKHFNRHADEISDAERCSECMPLSKGHAPCGDDECICYCTTFKEGG